ncbi:hypothetical protein ASL14_25315 (plasmid) [Paenibacillus sp. IHB B 3084]|nr:hypothetical protein ASL14_25315 [Paenibacillus sp. IHB B 3084]
MGIHYDSSFNFKVEETALSFQPFLFGIYPSKKIDSSVILKVNYGKHILVSKAILTWEVS